MVNNELTQKIIGCCIEAHKNLGPGLFESVYEEALCYELTHNGIPFTRQQNIPIQYKGQILENGFRADVIVNDSIIVEIKSVEKMTPLYSKQLLTYLRLTGKRFGLLINFNVTLLKEGIERVVNGY